MKSLTQRVLWACLIVLPLGATSIGCADHDPRVQQAPALQPAPPVAPSLLDGVSGAELTTKMLNFTRTAVVGTGYIGVSAPTDPNDPLEVGFNKVVTFWLVFSGDNAPASNENPAVLPSFADDAGKGRGGEDYSPLDKAGGHLKHVTTGADGSQLWKVTVTRFPAGGSFLFTLMRHYDPTDASKNKYFKGQGFDSSYVETIAGKKVQSFQFWYTVDRIVTHAAPGESAPPAPLPAPTPPIGPTTPNQHFAQYTNGHTTKELQGGTTVLGDGFAHLEYLAPVDANNHRGKITVMLNNLVAGESNKVLPGEQPRVWLDYEFSSGLPSTHFDGVVLTQISGTDLWEATVDTLPNNGRFYVNVTRNGDDLNSPSTTFVRGLDKDSAYDLTKQMLQFWIAQDPNNGNNLEVFGPDAPGGTNPPPPPTGAPPPPPPPPPAQSHFAVLNPAEIASITSEVVGGQSTGGDGISAIGTTTSVSGNSATLKITVYLGPWGTHDNTPAPGQTPYLFPNYIDGAEVGRPGAHYQPIELTEVPGSNRTLWECTIRTFPTNGTFLYTLTKDGNDLVTFANNVPVAGLDRDSSYHGPTQSLQASWDSTAGQPTTPVAP